MGKQGELGKTGKKQKLEEQNMLVMNTDKS